MIKQKKIKMIKKKLFIPAVVLFVILGILPFNTVVGKLWGPPPEEKLAFFFYSSDVARESHIKPYADILEDDYGYVPFLYEDTTDIKTVFQTIDEWEESEDELFFYFYGHGTYNEKGLEQSRFLYAPYFTTQIGSEGLRSLFDEFEAKSICILIESCHSGEFVDRFEDDDRVFLMTSADRYTSSHAVAPFPAEGRFSKLFWESVDLGDHVLNAFTNARWDGNYFYNPDQYPQKTSHCSSAYSFF